MKKLPRPADSFAFRFQRLARSFGLHRVGVPRSIHESLPHVKHIFEKFRTFLQENFKNIEKSIFLKIAFLALFRKTRKFG